MATWISGGRLPNPTAGQIVADTGPLAAGVRTVQVIVSSSVAAVCELQQRNAANTVTLKSQIIAVPATGTAEITIQSGIDSADNERFRVELVAAITGNLSASIIL